MRKTAATVVIAFLFSAIVLTGFVSSISANPYFEYRATATPIITIHTPINGTCANAVLLNFTVSKPEAWAGTQGVDGMLHYLSAVIIEIDGKQYDRIYAYDSLSSPFEYSTFLANLTEGPHNLTVLANAHGFSVEMHGLWKYSIPINSSSVAYFTLDTIAPLVSVVSLESKTYDSTGFTVELHS
jgi:hypothetical protein